MRAAIYARKSTEQVGVAVEARSVQRQVEHATAYALARDWVIAEGHVYTDDGISGAEFDRRPGLVRLMTAAMGSQGPPFEVLIMSEESRLGRETIETAYLLKQLLTAGVRVFYYLEDRERVLETPTDKLMLSVSTFAAELERDKARQRTHEALVRKAKAGRVPGGRVYGYRNQDVWGEAGPDGRRRRDHVEYAVQPDEAVVVRRIFELCARGYGIKRIAHTLNAEGARPPIPTQGRPAGWAPSSIRAMLLRPLYHGELVWNRTRKRDTWGRKRQSARPMDDWTRVAVPHLQLVSDELWEAAHARLSASRRLYRDGAGSRGGRPPSVLDSTYLLTGLATCALCGGSLHVRSRAHGHQRAFFYGCIAYHTRGTRICANRLEARMAEANHAVLSTIEHELLDPDVVQVALDQVLSDLRPARAEQDARRSGSPRSSQPWRPNWPTWRTRWPAAGSCPLC